jgi:hypothetical protein
MNAFILAYLALRSAAQEKRVPEPEFQPFRLEFLRPVKENGDEPSSPAFDQSGETAIA